MGFWIAAVVLAVITAVYVARPLALARRASKPRAAHDEQVFRDQLIEIDRDQERGVLSVEEARSARIEISRRLLAAAAEREASPDHQPAPKALSWGLAGLLLVGAPMGGWAVYEIIGAPGLPDQPIAARNEGRRPSQEIAEAQLARRLPPPALGPEAAELEALVGELEARLAEGEVDSQGLFLLARGQADLGRHAEAWRTYARLFEREGDNVPGGLFVAKAESMIIATGGYVSPEAEAMLEAALARSPREPVARYYLGAAQAQTNRHVAALDTWLGLLAESPETAPWRAATIEQIDDLVARTRLPRPEIPAAPAPSPEEQRAVAMRMIGALDARLAEQGGDPGEWLQLVKSYSAFGMVDEAAAAEARARAALDGAALAAFETGLAEGEAAAPVEPPHDMGALRETVAALDARLRDEGGGAGAWLRLIASYGALGDGAAAADAETRARAALADDAAQLAALEAALGGMASPGLGAPGAGAAAEAPPDRVAVARTMVDSLRDRLLAEGGSVEDWGRLIRGLGVLGDPDGATDAFERAMAAHGRDGIAAAFLTETALLAGATVR